MRKAVMGLAVLAMVATPALGAVGDWWTLCIDRVDNESHFTVYPGCGYDCGNGPTDCYRGTGMDGVARLWWNTLNACETSPGAQLPDQAELFTVEYYCCCAECDAGAWQPIEAQFNGYTGDAYPIEPNIPWAGAYGTNHQYEGTECTPEEAGTWKQAGPGPQAPESADYNAGPSGIYMWMKSGSVLYAKWDFGWDIDRCWDCIRITQVTPEPASALLLLLAAPVLLRRRSR
jgi:hypothetical protein